MFMDSVGFNKIGRAYLKLNRVSLNHFLNENNVPSQERARGISIQTIPDK